MMTVNLQLIASKDGVHTNIDYAIHGPYMKEGDPYKVIILQLTYANERLVFAVAVDSINNQATSVPICQDGSSVAQHVRDNLKSYTIMEDTVWAQSLARKAMRMVRDQMNTALRSLGGSGSFAIKAKPVYQNRIHSQG